MNRSGSHATARALYEGRMRSPQEAVNDAEGFFVAAAALTAPGGKHAFLGKNGEPYSATENTYWTLKDVFGAPPEKEYPLPLSGWWTAQAYVAGVEFFNTLSHGGVLTHPRPFAAPSAQPKRQRADAPAAL